jgi:hypothetical protein
LKEKTISNQNKSIGKRVRKENWKRIWEKKKVHEFQSTQWNY